MATLDRFDDGGAYLEAIESSLECAFSVPKKYAVQRSEDYALVEKTASGMRYRYPLHTVDEAVVSLGYFLRYGGNLDHGLQKTAAAKINEALASYGLRPNSELEKVASLPLGFSDAEGRDINEEEDAALRRLFGVGDQADVEELTRHFDDQSPRGKRRLAFMAKEASAHIQGMEDYVTDQFGTDLEVHIGVRGQLMDDRLAAKNLLSKVASMSPEAAVAEIEAFDKEHSLQRLYITHGLADPFQTVYGRELSKVASFPKSVDLGGYDLSEEQFTDFIASKKDSLEGAFGSDLAGELAAQPMEVYDSLPLPYKQAIAEMYNP